MIGESIAIMVVLAVAAGMALRSGRKAMVVMTVPFCCVPLAYLIGEAIFFHLREIPHKPGVISVLLGGLCGVAVTFIAAGLVSDEIKNARRIYIPFALVFVAAIAVTYCIRLLG